MRRGEDWVASFRPWRRREVGKVRAIDRTLLGEGPLTRDEMAGVEKSLRAVLGIF